MLNSQHLQTLAWVSTTILELILLIQLVRKRVVANYPFFTLYLASTILQSAVVATVYTTMKTGETPTWAAVWGTQAAVAIMRALAIVELNKKVLSAYAGIWGLARHLLLGVGLAVILYTLLFSKGLWEWIILNGARGFELASASVIVTMLLFARFYRLPIRSMPRALSIGFCMYSAFYVVNYSLLEKIIQQYGEFWNFLGIVTFVASLLVWISAVNKYVAVEDGVKPASISPEVYGKLSSEVNLRLHLLNRRLMLLMRTEEPRS